MKSEGHDQRLAILAAQFSQTQTALEGGEVGWVQPNQLDPEVARLVVEMPPGAVSAQEVEALLRGAAQVSPALVDRLRGVLTVE